jgi:hypothetical protein
MKKVKMYLELIVERHFNRLGFNSPQLAAG